MAFRRSPEDRAARREAKQQRKIETRERLRGLVEERRRDERGRQEGVLTAMLEEGEEVEALLQTAEALMKKYVLLTSKRLIVASAHDPRRAESILYRAINGHSTSNFITRDLALEIAGRRDKLELRFETDDERSQALRVLQAHTT